LQFEKHHQALFCVLLLIIHSGLGCPPNLRIWAQLSFPIIFHKIWNSDYYKCGI